MPKNIIFCADGTWDDPDSHSNVCQLFEALEDIPGVQLPIYDSGVGTNGLVIVKLLGGALGAGLFQKIKDGYEAIAAQYVPGDQIFIFGFSRGAYTARCLAGMIAICGLPTVNQTDPKCLDTAFEAYRQRRAQRDMLACEPARGTTRWTCRRSSCLAFGSRYGRWYFPQSLEASTSSSMGFCRHRCAENVLNAVQALAIDEQRLQFQPAIWTANPFGNQSMTQVWFAGAHSDVGGGNGADANGASLSNITLLWMANSAKIFGLQFAGRGAAEHASASQPCGVDP